MLKLKATKTYYTVEKANEMSEALNADTEDTWTYKANHDPKGTGYSFVEIYDEDNEYVGTL